jgi:small subunit ribosomal protein S16
MRIGAKKKPFYRIVVTDARKARDKKFLEVLGFYNPLTDPPQIKLDRDKMHKWVEQGAQLTQTMKGLLKV